MSMKKTAAKVAKLVAEKSLRRDANSTTCTGIYQPMRKIVVFFIVIFLFSVVVILLESYQFSLSYDFIAKYEADNIDSLPVWFTVRSKEFEGFYDEEVLKMHCKDYEYGLLDTTKYTYIVTCSHQLMNASYSFSEVTNRKLLFIPKQYVGRVVLSYEKSKYIYIYKIKKIDIDCDFHDQTRNVFYMK